MRVVLPSVAWMRILPLVVVIGCQGAGERLVAPVPDPPPPPPPTTGLRLDGLPWTIVSGVSLYATASLAAPPYTSQADAVTWSSSDTTVLRISRAPHNAVFVVGLRPGTAFISAVTGRLGGQLRVDVVARPAETLPTAETSLEITRFALLDLGGEDGWGFLPEIEARSRDGSPLTVLGLELDVPGVGALPSCWTARVLAGAPQFLIQESYGYWELWYSSEQRYTSGPVKARVIAREASGRVVAVEVTGVVEPGGWPVTYSTARMAPWNCGH